MTMTMTTTTTAVTLTDLTMMMMMMTKLLPMIFLVKPTKMMMTRVGSC